MNWYKSALKKEAITYQEFFKFYAYSAIPPEIFEQYPQFLDEFIEHLNNIKYYYSSHLLKEIGEELKYINERSPIDPVDPNVFFKAQRLSEQFINTSIKQAFLLPKDFEEARYLFKTHFNSTAFGGEPWAQITDWTEKLYYYDDILQETYSPNLMNKVLELTMIIDMIHSLEHNSGQVLITLPQNEKIWLQSALDFVNKVINPSEVARLSGDSDIANLYWREIVPQNDLQQREQHKEQGEQLRNNMFEDMAVKKYKEEIFKKDNDSFNLKKTKDVNLLKAALALSINDTDVFKNPIFLSNIKEIIEYLIRSSTLMAVNRIIPYIKDHVNLNELFKNIDASIFQENDLERLTNMIIQYPFIDEEIFDDVYSKFGYDNMMDYLSKIEDQHAAGRLTHIMQRAEREDYLFEWLNLMHQNGKLDILNYIFEKALQNADHYRTEAKNEIASGVKSWEPSAVDDYYFYVGIVNYMVRNFEEFSLDQSDLNRLNNL